MLPPALLFAALAFALAFATPRIRAWSLLGLLAACVALAPVIFPSGWLETAFFGCWISVVCTAVAIYLPRGPGLAVGVLLSLNAAFWACAVVALAGVPLDLLGGLAAILLIFPATWLVARGGMIAIKVAASWLIAIAILAAVLPFLAVTPGYVPDHLE